MVQTRRARTAEALRNETLEAVVQRLRALSQPARRPGPSGDVRVWLTQRSVKLSTHQGEVCLPGGKRDAADSCPQRALAPDVDVATALREAQEELGLDPQLAAPLLALPPVLSKHFLSVTPVVATVPNDFQPQPCADEVAAVFDMPLAAFLEDGAAHEHNDVTWQPGITYRIHSFRHEKGYVVWGLTAGILVHVAQMALGRSADYQVHCPGGVDYSTLHHDGEKLAIRVGTGND